MKLLIITTSLALAGFAGPATASAGCEPGASGPALETPGSPAQVSSAQHWGTQPGLQGIWLYPPLGEPGAWQAPPSRAAALAGCTQQSSVERWRSHPEHGTEGMWLFPPLGEPGAWSGGPSAVSTPNARGQLMATNHWRRAPDHGADGTWLYPPLGEPGRW